MTAVACACFLVQFVVVRRDSEPARQAGATGPIRLALAEQWVRDARPLQRAWAADIIRRDHLEQLIPQLIEALGNLDALSPAPQDLTDEDYARFALLNALIELQADVPVAAARALLPRYPAQAIVLALRSKSFSVQDAFEFISRMEVDA